MSSPTITKGKSKEANKPTLPSNTIIHAKSLAPKVALECVGDQKKRASEEAPSDSKFPKSASKLTGDQKQPGHIENLLVNKSEQVTDYE